VMQANRTAIKGKMPLLARVLDLPRRDFDAVLDWILALRHKLGVPHTLGELGVKESDAKSLAADAVKDPTAGGNPRKLSEAEFEALTLAAIRGDVGGR
jgi:alcohol dehydrogenase class IV